MNLLLIIFDLYVAVSSTCAYQQQIVSVILLLRDMLIFFGEYLMITLGKEVIKLSGRCDVGLCNLASICHLAFAVPKHCEIKPLTAY